MSLASESIGQSVAHEGLSAQARARCEEARRREEAGEFEEAAGCLGEFWLGVGVRPRLEGLDRRAAAEVLTRAGVLTGWLGSLEQVKGAQERAKDFLSEGAAIFADLEDNAKVFDARIDLSICYWREGATDEARAIIEDLLSQNPGVGAEQQARALIALAMVERRAARYNDALSHLRRAAHIVKSDSSAQRKGVFHNQLATTLENLGRSEGRSDYIDQALVEYEAASFYFEEAGHQRYRARVENNFGFLFYKLNRLAEAHEHFDRARALLDESRDLGILSQVDDNRARAFLAEGRFEEAARVASDAVRIIENGGEQSLLAEALTTYGLALARLEKFTQAEAALRRAIEVGERSGDLERAGLSALTLLEQVGEQFPVEERRAVYTRADELLSNSQDAEVDKRIRACARALVSPPARALREPGAPEFVHAAPATEEMLRRVRLIARAGGPALLTGETGTGKEALARVIHHWSARPGKFVTINGAGLSDALFELRLFGRTAGEVEGDAENRGAISEAAGGTLFFDEVGELSAANQAMLLRLLESVESGCGTNSSDTNVRVIASSNEDLERLVAKGFFRADLFYRLQNFHVVIPPLRERRSDIPALASHFIEQASTQLQKNVTFAPEAVEALSLLPLKGNARELKSLIERTILTAEDGSFVMAQMVEVASMRDRGTKDLTVPWEGFSLKEEVHRIERRFIEFALRDAGGKISHAARLLGFKHHESLASLLKSRHRELLSARTPARKRRRSIIRRDKH